VYLNLETQIVCERAIPSAGLYNIGRPIGWRPNRRQDIS